MISKPTPRLTATAAAKRTDNALREYCISRWGPPPPRWHSHTVHYTPPNPLFHVLASTDFAMDHLHTKCIELAALGTEPLLKEHPHEQLFRLTTLLLVPKTADLRAIALRTQGLVRDFFVPREAGDPLRADYVVSTRPPEGAFKLSRRDDPSQLLMKINFPHISLSFRSTLVSFEKLLARALEPLLPCAAGRLITTDIFDSGGLTPNTMTPWTKERADVLRDPKSAFNAVACISDEGEDAVELLDMLRASATRQASTTTSLAFEDSPGCCPVHIGDTWVHELLRDWAKKAGVLLKYTEGSTATHSALQAGDKSGYTMRLTDPTQQQELYGMAGRLLSGGYAVMLTERAKGVFAMFLDMDLKTEEEVDWDELHEAATASAIATMGRVYGDASFADCVVSSSDTVTLPNGTLSRAADCPKSAGKRGLHLVFPNVLVDKSLALALRGQVVAHLVNDLQDRPFSWDDAVDISVYNGAGLRVLGAFKSKKAKNESWAHPVRSAYSIRAIYRDKARDREGGHEATCGPGRGHVGPLHRQV
jgi:hypothetical protein